MNISVVICTFNGEKYIEPQLKSVLDQSVSVDEILIFDDGSKDGTVERAKAFLSRNAKGINYRITVNPNNYGVTKNFLNGLKQSRGELVFTADQDDIWFNNKVEIFSKAYKKSRKMLYFSDGVVTDSDGNPKGFSLWESREIDYQKLDSQKIFSELLRKYIVTGSAMAVSRELIDLVDYYPQYWVHDAWLALLAASYDSIEPINEKTYYFRRHESNVTIVKKRRTYEKIKAWKDNITVLPISRHKSFNRFSEALEHMHISKQSVSKIKNCVKFWYDIDGISNKGRVGGSAVVIKNYLVSNYSKYYTGLRGAFRDLMSVFVLKNKNIKSPLE